MSREFDISTLNRQRGVGGLSLFTWFFISGTVVIVDNKSSNYIEHIIQHSTCN